MSTKWLKVKITKLDDNIGETRHLPKVGESFAMYKPDTDGMYQTSTVLEVDEEKGIFKTRNSVYKYEVIE